MATLSTTTAFTRKLLRWTAIIVGAALGLMLLFRIAVFIKNQIAPPAPPTVSFGKLPKVSFPQTQTVKTLSYSIDTVTGALPVFSDRSTVYKTLSSSPDLLALDKATRKVSAVGFGKPGAPVSEGVYQWLMTDQGLSKKIVLNIFSGDFNLSSAFLTDPQVLSANNLPNQTAALNLAQNFLSNMSSQPDDIDMAKTSTKLLSIKNGTLTQATSLSNTQIVQVSFFQKDLGGLPIVYSDATASIINVFVAGGSSSPQVVRADFFHQNIASESATYPIINASQAFDKLKNGDAYIASYDGVNQKISINKVMLAYYLSDQPQAYVIPVVVFKGNSGFTAYAWAIKEEWIQK